MTKPKNRNIPTIPRPPQKGGDAPSAPSLALVPDDNVETKPASKLTKTALNLLLQRYQMEAEAVANQAAEAEGIDLKDGWKLSTDGVWFRDKPKEKAKDKTTEPGGAK